MCLWWRASFDESSVGAGDDERSRDLAANDRDELAVDVSMVTGTQENQVVDVRRAVGPRVDVMRLAPLGFALATGNLATLVPDVENPALAVAGGVGDLAEVERDRGAGHDDSADGAFAGPLPQDFLGDRCAVLEFGFAGGVAGERLDVDPDNEEGLAS